MFICRFRLAPRFSPSPTPSLPSHALITPRFSSRATTPSPQSSSAPIPFQQPSSSSTLVFGHDLSPRNNTPTSDRFSGWPSQGANGQCHAISDHNEAKNKQDTGHSSTLCTLYSRLSVPGCSRLPTQISSEQVCSIALRAQNEGHASVLDNLASNILDSTDAVRTELATALLSVPRLRLNPSLTASLLFCVSPDHLSSIPLDALSHIACTLIYHPSPSSVVTLLTSLAEDIARRLPPLWRKVHGRPVSGRHAISIWSLCRFVVHLSELRLREPAMRLFQSLVETTYIPPEAIQRVDQSLKDFHLIIILTLVRSCVFWKWNRRALALLRDYLGRGPPVDPAINRLCQDVLYALMEFPTAEDLVLCISFVKDMISGPGLLSVPPGIVRQIYSSAQRLRKPQLATSLYMLTQCGPISSSHEFPLPSGPSLTWFLRYLSNQAVYLHIARRLVKQVTDRREPIPLSDRAEFITIAAKNGFASPARTLWERYSSGNGGQMVVGNAAMVVRMCSLFARLYQGKASYVSENSGLVDKTTTSLDLSGTHGDANGAHTSLLEEEEDLRNFANLVLTTFREAKEPLLKASREDLNALARANVILGHVTEALRVLRVVIQRSERPDLHDINVILSAAANADPRMALRMVRRMIALGLKPDCISLGTIIHQAARQADLDVMVAVLRLAQKTGQQLTTKTVVAVIRASIIFSGTDKDAIRDNLVRALGIIMANEDSNHLATTDMGKFCANEALKADDPSLAFKFWKQVLRPRAEWYDYSHVSLRCRIASSIRSHCKKGNIRTEDGLRMVLALRGAGGRGKDNRG